MWYVRLFLMASLLVGAGTARAEASADDYRGAPVGRCFAADGTLSACARVNGRNLGITADLTGQVFVPVLQNGQAITVTAPPELINRVVALYRLLLANFQRTRTFNPRDPNSFRDPQHLQLALTILNRNGGVGGGGNGVGPGLEDAIVERCTFRQRQGTEIRTTCARLVDRKFLLFPDRNTGKLAINFNGRIVPAPQSVVDQAMQMYQGMFDRYFKDRKFNPNDDNAFRDQEHLNTVAKVVQNHTGLIPKEGVTFAKPNGGTPEIPDLLGGNGDHGGAGADRPTLEPTNTLFAQRKAKFKDETQTRKPEVTELMRAIGTSGQGGLIFVPQTCAYPDGKVVERTLALGLKSNGDVFAQVLPKEKEGKVTLDQLAAGGVQLTATDDPPPALRGKRLSAELGPTPLTAISVRSYQDNGQTKYLARFSLGTDADDPVPTVAYCGAKGDAPMQPVSWKDTAKPASARLQNLFATSCAKCHGAGSSRKVKFNADGTLKLAAGQTEAQINTLIAARASSTDPDKMMPPPGKLADADRATLRQLVKLWRDTGPTAVPHH